MTKYRVEFVEEVLHVFHNIEANDEEEAIDAAFDHLNPTDIPDKIGGEHEWMGVRIRSRHRVVEVETEVTEKEIYDSATKFENEND